MPMVSYDSQSFQVDGRRIWLVSGTIQYARIPRDEWEDRILAAKTAGLNCICVDIFWNAHEPQRGTFDFTGQHDLRAFIEAIGRQRMYCILRPGPHIGDGSDLGGIPAWVLGDPNARLREASEPFLEATSRYFAAVMKQVRDLQITTPINLENPPDWAVAGGGPIVLMQVENHWRCHNPEQAGAYLGELVRYLRENDCGLPITINNNLWQRVPGAIDTWSIGAGVHRHISNDLRQFQLIQPKAPRLVAEYAAGSPAYWHPPIAQMPSDDRRDAQQITRELVEILASGAQYNVHPLTAGTNFGFTAGRGIEDDLSLSTATTDGNAPLGEGGAANERYDAIRNVSTFASQFGAVLAQLDPTTHHTAVSPADYDSSELSVIHQHGTAGDAVFLLRGSRHREKLTKLLLPNGLVLPVHLDGERSAWFLLNANLGGVAELTYSNLRPLAFVDRRLLVMFGPAGTDGVIAIDHAPLHVTVPKDKQPVIENHDAITVVVLSTEQAQASLVHDGKLYIGASRITAGGDIVAHAGWSSCHTVTPDGSMTTSRIRAKKSSPAPKLKAWATARCSDLIAGDSASFETIDGPKPLEALAPDSAYGWYRVAVPGGSARKLTMFGHAADRVHLYAKGKRIGIFGEGADTTAQPASLSLSGVVVALVDSMGRSGEGFGLNQRKGIGEHLYGVTKVKLGKPKVDTAAGPNFAKLVQFVPGHRVNDLDSAIRLSWDIRVSGKMPMLLDLKRLPIASGLVMVDDLPVGVFGQTVSPTGNVLLLKVGEHLESRRKQNLSLIVPPDLKSAGVESRVALYQTSSNVTEKSAWAFAPFAQPDADAFEPLASSHKSAGAPAWFRGAFASPASAATLWFEPIGLTKGQLYLNGRNVGRYAVADSKGKRLSRQKRYYLPVSWLNQSGDNVLVLFDEYGADPRKVKLVVDADGAF